MALRSRPIIVVALGLVAGLWYWSVHDQKTDETQKQVQQLLADAEKVLSQKQPEMASRISSTNAALPPNHPPVTPSDNPPQSARQTKPVVEVAESSFWHELAKGKGMASVRYQIQLDGQNEELAVIRMNRDIPLDDVIAIWKQRVGLQAQDQIEYQSFTNKHQQSMYLAKLKGQSQTLLLGIYKHNSYTFFRMMGDNRSDEKAMTMFKQFLGAAKIID